MADSTDRDRAWRRASGVVLCLALYAAAWSGVGGVLAIPFLFAAFVINTIAHEAGHAIVAFAAGHRVHVIAVGKVAFFPESRRFTFGYRFRPGILGHVVHTPPRDHQNAYDWDGWITAAGPLANFLLTAICVICAGVVALGDARWGSVVVTPSNGIHWSAVIGAFAAISLLIGLSNLIPLFGAQDGKTLVRRFDGYRPTDAERRLTQLCALSAEGDKGAWDEGLLRQVEDDKFDGGDALLRDRLLVSRYLRTGDVHALKRVLQKSEATQNLEAADLVMTYAFAIALVDRNGEIAAKWLDCAPRACRDSFAYWRSKAVVLAVKGEHDAARAAVAEARNMDAGDDDDAALFAAIESGAPLPVTFVQSNAVPA